MKVNIYTQYPYNQYQETLSETIDSVESCKVQGGYIHIKFDDSVGSCGGLHFPVPYGFTRVELIKDISS